MFFVPIPSNIEETGHCLETLRDVITTHADQLAAVVMEPIVSVGGMVYPPKGYFTGVRLLCDECDVLLVFDESQTGFGRTGSWFCYQEHGVMPDMVICSKGIGMGYPVSAVLFNAKLLDKKITMTHYSSHQNDPFAAGLISFGIAYITGHNLLESNKSKGGYFLNKLKEVCCNNALFRKPRGHGLMLGMDLFVDGVSDYRPLYAKVYGQAADAGVLLQGTDGGRVLRFLPDYLISEDDMDFCADVLLVYGGGSIKRNGIYQKVVNQLSDFRITEFSGIEPNPDVESVRRGVVLCKEKEIDVILAVGGGSVIDAAKWIAVSACVGHDPWDFFCKETTIGNALPIITVVTIASTGSEMNNGGVLSNRELARKTGRGSPAMFPKASFLNPEFTYAVNGYQTACGVVDIISHVMEVYFTQQEGMSLLDGIMESMVRTVVKYGKVAIGDPENYEARANLLYAASWAINGFINGPVRQPWNCHTIEHELSARYPIAHGHGMAILLPRWLKYCFQAGNRALYEACARNMFSIDGRENSADALTEQMEKLFYEEFGLKPMLREFNVPHDALEDIAASICAQGPIKGFTELDGKDVRLILEKCF